MACPLLLEIWSPSICLGRKHADEERIGVKSFSVDKVFCQGEELGNRRFTRLCDHLDLELELVKISPPFYLGQNIKKGVFKDVNRSIALSNWALLAELLFDPSVTTSRRGHTSATSVSLSFHKEVLLLYVIDVLSAHRPILIVSGSWPANG